MKDRAEVAMGLLVDGAWQDVDMRVQDGHFVRKPTAFHNYVTADGSAGPTGKDGFAAEPGRYHLYVSLACPGRTARSSFASSSSSTT
jgi:putative glutathione S-transferase